MKKYWVAILAFILIFAEHYDFPFSGFGVTWKFVLVIVFFIYVLRNKVYLPGFFGLIFIPALILIFHAITSDNPSTDLSEVLVMVALPIGFMLGHEIEKNRLMPSIQLFTILLCIVNVLYIFHLLPQHASSFRLMKFGAEELGMNSIFHHVSSSSKIFTLLLIFLDLQVESQMINAKKYLVLYITLLISILFTYSRLTWIFVFVYQTVRAPFRVLLVVSGILLFISLSQSTLLTSLQNRLFNLDGKTFYQTTDLNKLSSGRLLLYETSIEILDRRDALEIWFGKGKYNSREDFVSILNKPTISHNRILELILYTGIIGLITFLVGITLFVRHIFITHKSNRHIKWMCYLMIFALLPSHGLSLYGDLIFGLILGNYERET